MADATPLLPQHQSHDEGPPGTTDDRIRRPKRSAATTRDDIIERCVGAAQLFQAFLVCFARAFDAQQTFINVFTDNTPSWHCAAPDADAGPCNDLHRGGPCGLPEGTWAWDRPPQVSIISDWSLECVGAFIPGLPASAYFAGCLTGGLALATLADSTLGRKKMLFLCCLGMAVAGLLTAAAPGVWLYSVLRFVGGFCRATVGTSALVLSMELVGKRWRGEVGIGGFICFTLGFFSLPVLAYAGRNSSWRTLYLWTSAPALLYSALILLLVPESPRWLVVRGRKDEAIKTLKDMAVSNRKDVSTCDFSAFDLFGGEDERNNSLDPYPALTLLLGTRWARRRLAAIMLASFGIGMVYYGVPLAVGTLGFNIFLSVALNAASELPSSLFIFFLIGRINRRSCVIVCTLTSGVLGVACVFVEAMVVRMAVETASFFCACMAFDVLLIYSLELFPTSVRNSALSMVRQASMLGSMFAPPLVAVARGWSGRFMLFGVLGLVIACGGLFIVFMPETSGGGGICDTLGEQEYREKAAAAADGAEGGGAVGEIQSSDGPWSGSPPLVPNY